MHLSASTSLSLCPLSPPSLSLSLSLSPPPLSFSNTELTDVHRLLRLHDTGVMSYLHDKWFPSQAGCQDNLSTPPSVTMATLQGPFYVALVALVVAAGVLFIERGVTWYMRRTTMVHDLSVMSAGE